MSKTNDSCSQDESGVVSVLVAPDEEPAGQAVVLQMVCVNCGTEIYMGYYDQNSGQTRCKRGHDLGINNPALTRTESSRFRLCAAMPMS